MGGRVTAAGIVAQVHRFDAHLETALRRLAARSTVDLEELPSAAVAVGALALHREPGPSPYVVVPADPACPIAGTLDDAIDALAVELYDRPGPAGYRCAELGYAAGAWWACLLPRCHIGRCGPAATLDVVTVALDLGAVAEFDDAGEGLEVLTVTGHR